MDIGDSVAGRRRGRDVPSRQRPLGGVRIVDECATTESSCGREPIADALDQTQADAGRRVVDMRRGQQYGLACPTSVSRLAAPIRLPLGLSHQ